MVAVLYIGIRPGSAILEDAELLPVLLRAITDNYTSL